MSNKQASPFEESRNIIIQYAIFRIENALILAGTILLTFFYTRPFSWWPVWGWPLLGLIGISIMAYSSITNSEQNARLLLESTQRSYNIRKIQLKELRAQMEQAMLYQDRIIHFLNENKNESILWGRAEETAQQMYIWVEHIYNLALAIDSYKRDPMSKQEMDRLPAEIEKLKSQKAKETNSDLLTEFEETLESKEKHLESVQSLDTRMKHAELNLEQSLSALATVDSQIRLLSAHTQDRGRSERLQSDINEQVNRLEDLLLSLEDVTQHNN